jgi:two-component system phosphate regulon sensor histidine kinase PhoR
LLLLLGAFVLRRTVRLHSEIEGQLRRAAETGLLESALCPVHEAEPAAQAWNSILERLNDQQTVATLESRLSGSLGSVEQQRWSDVFNSLSDGIAVCAANHTIIQVNNSLAALLQVSSSAELVGQNLFEAISKLSTDDGAGPLAALFPGYGPLARDVQLGPELAAGVLRLGRTPISSDGFSANTSLWTVRDVTHQKLAEEMRNQFVSTATHELRTPLTNIMAYAELLSQEDDLDIEKQKTFCNIITSEASRLSRFVDQMLNVSQMEAGALSLTRHETDIERLLHEVLENERPHAQKKRLGYDAQLPGKLPKLRVDKDKLAAALVNLLGNAIKYTPEEGSVKLTVEVTGEYAHFHVDDTGIGIAAEELPRISEKFFRSQDSRVRDITGSGLGLAFAQEVARLHGGRITVASELNKGSRFTLTLPLH